MKYSIDQKVLFNGKEDTIKKTVVNHSTKQSHYILSSGEKVSEDKLSKFNSQIKKIEEAKENIKKEIKTDFNKLSEDISNFTEKAKNVQIEEPEVTEAEKPNKRNKKKD